MRVTRQAQHHRAQRLKRHPIEDATLHLERPAQAEIQYCGFGCPADSSVANKTWPRTLGWCIRHRESLVDRRLSGHHDLLLVMNCSSRNRTVLTPFRDISVHIEEAKRIGGKVGDSRNILAAAWDSKVCICSRDGFTHPESRCGSCPATIFPFRFGWQA